MALSFFHAAHGRKYGAPGIPACRCTIDAIPFAPAGWVSCFCALRRAF
jgi:hypothetical protein